MVLSQIKGIGPKTLYGIDTSRIEAIKDDAGIYELYLDLCDVNHRIEPITRIVFKEIIAKVQDIETKNQELGIVTLTKYDKAYPNEFRRIPKPPAILFAKGNIDSLNQPGLAIIGTRDISSYGQKIGERFGEVVAENGRTVISGLAEGCDSAGHTGCLNKNGVTIAIVGTPLDQVYPKKNIALAERILGNNGCIISEYALGDAVTPYNFVNRDRLQCGLADGVIVIETGVTGGSLNAIRGAIDLHKPVGCFQYQESHYEKNINARGNKMLIERQMAKVLHNADSIQEFMGICDRAKVANEEPNLFDNGAKLK